MIRWVFSFGFWMLILLPGGMYFFIGAFFQSGKDSLGFISGAVSCAYLSFFISKYEFSRKDFEQGGMSLIEKYFTSKVLFFSFIFSFVFFIIPLIDRFSGTGKAELHVVVIMFVMNLVSGVTLLYVLRNLPIPRKIDGK